MSRYIFHSGSPRFLVGIWEICGCMVIMEKVYGNYAGPITPAHLPCMGHIQEICGRYTRSILEDVLEACGGRISPAPRIWAYTGDMRDVYVPHMSHFPYLGHILEMCRRYTWSVKTSIPEIYCTHRDVQCAMCSFEPPFLIDLPSL